MTISENRLDEIEEGIARIVRTLELERQLGERQFNSDRPDPLRSDQMRGWLNGELARKK